jgi:hypothetical protein
MEKLPLLIGEHLFIIKSTSSQTMANLKINYRHFVSLLKKSPQLSIRLEEGYGDPLSFDNDDVTTISDTNRICFKRIDYLIEVNPDYTKAKILVHDQLALKHALMTLYSSFIVHHNWGLLVHSSCVIDKGTAHIFTGHSGAGKSTTAKLSQPRKLLSDEATILKITEDEVTIFNSPFRSELDSKGIEKTTPLKSIQLLRQAVSNKRVELKKSEAILQLLGMVFYWSSKPEEAKEILQLLKIVVKNVPAYDLHFQKDNTFWELIS